MAATSTATDTRLPRRRWPWLAAAAGTAALLLACGGSSDSFGIFSIGDATATSIAASGPVSGFGSVIVNGVRFDDSLATITLDDDVASRDQDLRLGMVLDVVGNRNASDNTRGTASTISGSSFVQGPITTITPVSDNSINRQLTVLGLVVSVSNSTIFAGRDAAGRDVTGLISLNPGDIVEIHGIADGQDGLRATRIERKDPAVTAVRLVGTARSATATSFTLYGTTVQYQPAALANLSTVTENQIVRVKGALTAPGTIAATAVRGTRLGPVLREGFRTEIEGVISAFSSAASFTLNGVRVDATNASTSGLAGLGARAEVEGTVTNGILVANKVEIKDESQQVATELHGIIASVDPVTSTFTLRDGSVTVRWNASSTVFTAPLASTGLVPGARIEVRGRIAGNLVEAISIKIDSASP
jgi:hypothetical protein